jgi:hypothetical protein
MRSIGASFLPGVPDCEPDVDFLFGGLLGATWGFEIHSF